MSLPPVVACGAALAAALGAGSVLAQVVPSGQADPGSTRAVQPVSPAEFVKLHTRVAPKGSETWQTIPWRIDLGAAQREARSSGRPLFMWSMNGHPLGCT